MGERIIYPRPQWLSEGDGRGFCLGADVPILAAEGSRREAEDLQGFLRQDHGLELAIESFGSGRQGIVIGRLGDEAIRDLCRDRGIRVDGREAVAEGYLLHATDDHLLVAGHDAAGTFYGLQLLRQLIEGWGRELHVRAAEAHDWPNKPLRGVHLYMPPRQELPFFRRLLDLLAALRYNTLLLEVGGGLRYDRHPEINQGWEEYVARAKAYGISEVEHGFAWPKNSTHYELAGGSFLEKDEVRQILAWARALHIEVIPEVQSLSHSYYLCAAHPEIAEKQDDPFPDTYCPSNPASYELLFDVMEEVIEVFQPRIMHTGHDELYLYGLCPRCRGKSGAELIAGDVNRIHDFLACKGVRMAMWGDKLLNIVVGGQGGGGHERRIPAGTFFKRTEEFIMPETYQAVDMVPKDTLILNWTWEVDPQAARFYGAKGFEQIYGNLGHHGRWAFTGWDRKSAPEHVLGAEVSSWCEVSEYAFGHDACIFNLLFSSEVLWWSHYSDRERDRVLGTIARLQPYVRDRLGGRRTPSLAPDTGYIPLPLGAAANARVPFAGETRPCTDALSSDVDGRAVRVDRDNPEAAPIAVGRRATGLQFLHHCCCRRRYFSTWEDLYIVLPTPEGVLGWYRVVYEDGGQEDIEICYGENIANWDVPFGEDIAACCYWAEPAYEGRNPEGRPIVVYRYEWANPHPEKVIRSVQMISARGQGEIRLLGLTAVHGSEQGARDDA